MPLASKKQEVNILLVEDSLADQALLARAVRKAGFSTQLFTAENGEDALAFLRHQGVFQDPKKSPRPDLVLLDINMPRMDGKQVLEQIRKDDALRNLLVIMLTTSNRERDVLDSYHLGVNAYITKPNTMDDLVEAVKTLENFWFNLAELSSS